MIKLKSLPTKELRVTSFYGKRNTGIKGASTYHQGLDMGSFDRRTNEPLKAAMDFTVVESYYSNLRGWVVLLDHGTIDGNNIKTLFQHMKAKSPLKVGAIGKAKDVVGYMGATGVGAQLHLHMELRINNKPVDPLPYLIASFPSSDIKHSLSAKTNNGYVLEIKRLQENLNKMGIPCNIDGRFGPKTVQAVQTLQKQNKLAPDGSLGPKSIELLHKLGYQ